MTTNVLVESVILILMCVLGCHLDQVVVTTPNVTLISLVEFNLYGLLLVHANQEVK